MEWTSDNGQTYTAEQDSCQVRVWYSTVGEWKAFVRWAGSTARYASFTTREDAQAWCEAQLVELAAAGQCSKDVL
jgi:hypothetical protein